MSYEKRGVSSVGEYFAGSERVRGSNPLRSIKMSGSDSATEKLIWLNNPLNGSLFISEEYMSQAFDVI